MTARRKQKQGQQRKVSLPARPPAPPAVVRKRRVVWDFVVRLGVADLLVAFFALVLTIGVVVVPEGAAPVRLPLQFRVDRTALSDLPVVVSDLRSCGCWDGPRDQAVKKFKFGLENRGDRRITIGGGEGLRCGCWSPIPRGSSRR